MKTSKVGRRELYRWLIHKPREEIMYFRLGVDKVGGQILGQYKEELNKFTDGLIL